MSGSLSNDGELFPRRRRVKIDFGSCRAQPSVPIHQLGHRKICCNTRQHVRRLRVRFLSSFRIDQSSPGLPASWPGSVRRHAHRDEVRGALTTGHFGMQVLADHQTKSAAERGFHGSEISPFPSPCPARPYPPGTAHPSHTREVKDGAGNRFLLSRLPPCIHGGPLFRRPPRLSGGAALRVQRTAYTGIWIPSRIGEAHA